LESNLMESSNLISPQTIVKDSLSGIIVFLVALPLCLGIALASGAPLFSGLVAGIVGGIVVGSLSGSHTSVSGPAAGLTAIVAAQIAKLGSFEAFLLAVVVGGVIQIGLGVVRAGALSAFFPSSVIKGLLAAIGVILILKQIPHLLGHDTDPEGEMSFKQPDDETTFSEFFELFGGDIHYGAIVIGLTSLGLLIFWDRCRPLKNSLVPAPLVVVLLGVVFGRVFASLGSLWSIEASHMVQVPVANSLREFVGFLQFPDFSQILNPAIYIGGITIAIVASLETLLNLEAVDKLDTKQRHSPPSRELIAQGVGNSIAGMIGGLPMTSVIIRSSVNVSAGGQTKLSAILHGCLLLVCVMLMPMYLNMIPLSSLAAILLLTGFKLASPKLFRQMWRDGRYQFLPFILTVVAIVLTDLLIGILIGLGISLIFILASNIRRPIHRVVERHVGGDVLHIELDNQVSFLKRAALERVLREAPAGSHVLLDARQTDYIDPDVRSLIREFRDVLGPAHGVKVSLRGFRPKYELHDEVQFVDYTTRELQNELTPAKALQVLREGNQRFRTGKSLERDFARQIREKVVDQHPMAVVLSGIHSRMPAELIFDLGLGDVHGIRIGGNVVGPKVKGCVEYACAIAGAKLIVVMGHTGSALVTAAIDHVCGWEERDITENCPHLSRIIDAIQDSVDVAEATALRDASQEEKAKYVDQVARRNVLRSLNELLDESYVLRRLVDEGRVAAVGAMYDTTTGECEFLVDEAVGMICAEREHNGVAT
jgi:carbonic anhydrase/SulP family sulfate permease